MTTRSVDKQNSRYVQGGITENFADRTGWSERYVFTKSIDDELLYLPAIFAQRPDLLAEDRYRDSSLMWLVLQYNNILDITTEFTEGTLIRLPTASRVQQDILVNSPGGEDIV